MDDTNALINWLKKNTENPLPEELNFKKRLEKIPQPMQRYLMYALPNGPRPYRFLDIELSGSTRYSRLGWSPLETSVYYSLPRPNYIRLEKAKFLSIFPVRSRDLYLAGEGNLLIKVLGRLPLRNYSGPQLDRRGMIRYLSETPWFPEFFLNPTPLLKWEEIDAVHVRAILQDGKNSVSIVFTINPKGEISKGETWDMVNMSLGSIQRWTIHYSNYREIDGARLPYNYSAEWKLNDRPSPYLDLSLRDIHLT